MKKVVCLLALMVTIIGTSHARQVGDSTLRRNTIKLDITSYWLYRDAVVLSYERVVKPYQSWGITLGYQEFPPLSILASNITNTKDEASRGLKYATEYRFYLQKDNKYKAPRGVYLGPYLSVLNFKNTRQMEVTTGGVVESAIVDSKIDIINIGVQLGYQFVLNNRWTIDLVFIGPSVSNYRAKFELGGDYTGDPEEITNDIIEALIDQYPGFSELITDKEFSNSGKINSWAYGYRYQFQLGYHFGRKKK